MIVGDERQRVSEYGHSPHPGSTFRFYPWIPEIGSATQANLYFRFILLHPWCDIKHWWSASIWARPQFCVVPCFMSETFPSALSVTVLRQLHSDQPCLSFTGGFGSILTTCMGRMCIISLLARKCSRQASRPQRVLLDFVLRIGMLQMRYQHLYYKPFGTFMTTEKVVFQVREINLKGNCVENIVIVWFLTHYCQKQVIYKLATYIQLYE